MIKYCPDVWKNLFIDKINHQQVKVGFCCQNVTVEIPGENWQSVIENKRRDFLENEWPEQCTNCWKVEKIGAASKRHHEITWYSQQGIEQDTNAAIIALEWNCENLCNLACVTCGPVFSSRWNSEIKKYPWKDIEKYQPSYQNQFFKTLDLSSVRRVYFNGGEPLMSTDHTQIMQHLQEIGVLSDCEIAYNTNGTVIPDQTCVDLWKKARLVRVFISIDAVENNFEFIRWPGKWHQILEFLNFLKNQHFNIIVDITCTLGIHNIFSLHRLYDWYFKECRFNHQGDPVSLNLQLCGPISHGGKVLSLEQISCELSDIVLQYLDKLSPDIDTSAAAAACLKANGNDLGWTDYLDNLSIQRNIDWKKNLPELAFQHSKIS